MKLISYLRIRRALGLNFPTNDISVRESHAVSREKGAKSLPLTSSSIFRLTWLDRPIRFQSPRPATVASSRHETHPTDNALTFLADLAILWKTSGSGSLERRSCGWKGSSLAVPQGRSEGYSCSIVATGFDFGTVKFGWTAIRRC